VKKRRSKNIKSKRERDHQDKEDIACGSNTYAPQARIAKCGFS
jgi:hypothetical protein